jgi:hypothetical protein
MKTLLTLIVLLLFSSSVVAESMIYNCTFKNNTGTLSYPDNILAVIDFNEQKLEKYLEDTVNLTRKYECYKCVSDEKRVEIKLKNYDPWGNSKEDIDNARVFEIYSSDLVGHLWKPFVPGVNYQCIKF